MEIFSKTLIHSVTSPLTEAEEASYRKALTEYDSGEAIQWNDLR